MRFEYKQFEDLPPLAWLAYIKNGIITVIHGKNVETKDDFFVEGAWNGPFLSGDFGVSDWFCGTGGKIEGNQIVFSTPSHVTSGLFMFHSSEEVLVSNSLHFLCAYARFHLDPQYLNYEIDFNSILYGINEYKDDVYVIGENNTPVDVKVHYYRNIRIDERCNITVFQKTKVEPFTSFDDYYERLTNAIGGMIENAQDNSRKITYGLVTTVSKGYDAPCCAAVAKKFGCDTAVTFKALGKYDDDCGTDVARALGYSHIIEKDANEYLKNEELIEAYAIASGDLGTDFQFACFDEYFADKLVFIGERGDKIWARSFDSYNDNYMFNDFITGIGASERKLWIGYISVPMPLYGASSWTSIQRVSQSKEMKPWCLGNEYDRPIPRRICECSGINREMFGIKKHGAGIVLRYDWGSRAKSRMSHKSVKSFEEFVRKNGRLHPLQLMEYFWNVKKIYLSRIGIRINDKTTNIEKSQIANATSARYLFPWASEIVQKKYRKILQKRG